MAKSQINIAKYNHFSNFEIAIDALTSLGTNKNLIADATSSGLLTIREETLWEKFLALIRWKPKGLRLENVKVVVQNLLKYNQEYIVQLDKKKQNKLLKLHLFKNENLGSLTQLTALKYLQDKVKENQDLICKQREIIKKKEEKLKQINDEYKNEKLIAKMKLVVSTPVPLTINSDTLSVLKTCRNDPKADLFIVTSDGKEIPAERRFLPPFFSNETLEQMKEKEQQGIKIDLSHVVDSATVNLFLDFEYGIPIQQNLTIDQLMKLYEFADYVGEQKLKKEILNILLKQLNEQTLQVIFSILIGFNEQDEIEKEMLPSFMNEIKKMDLPNETWVELYRSAKKNDSAKIIQEKIMSILIHNLNEENYGFVLPDLMSLLDEVENRFAWTALVPWVDEKLHSFMILDGFDQKFFSVMMEHAKKGDSWAEYRVGACYAKGFGVEQDVNAAFQWLHLGENNGEIRNIRSSQLLVEIYKEQKKFKESFNLLNRIHTTEDATASIKYELALHYDNGWGINQDLDEARKLYIEAASRGHRDAKRRLENGSI